MPIPHDYDIAIIGDGITGLSAAFHLQKLGFSRLCLFAKPKQRGATVRASGFLSGGLLDNFTRLSHPRGMDTGKILWSFADLAFDTLLDYLQTEGIPFDSGERMRWVVTPEEATEAKKATLQLNQCGFPSQWQEKSEAGSVLQGIQYDGRRAAYVDPESLLNHLRSSLHLKLYGEALKVIVDKDDLRISDSNAEARTQCVIYAQHLEIATLLPSLHEALVPFADQWSEYRLKDASLGFPWQPGSVFSWQHSHVWGVITSKQTLRLGGARYLRPMAGIEALTASYEPKITKHLAEAWNGLWPSLPVEPTGQGSALRDCRPCDELPIIGPMFGESRILLGTGYMGQGLALGFMAGRCLAELIAGQPTQLPRMLWPERLRSLPSDAGEEHD